MRLGPMMRLDRTVKDETLEERAKEIKIPKATLLRLEKGHPVEIDTFMNVLTWLTSDAESSSNNQDR